MAEAVASMRAWLGTPRGACLVVGSTGVGKSHLLNSAVGDMADFIVMPPPDGSDCSQFLDTLRAGAGYLVVADDLDKFAKGLREEVIKLVAKFGHVLLASLTELSVRNRRILNAKYSDVIVITLTDCESRKEDVRAFIDRWIELSGRRANENAVRECTAFCCASGLPQGFRTIEAFLEELARFNWEFSGTLPAPDAASAYREATSPPPTLPTILVEGYTDRVYLEWLLQGLPSTPAVEVRDCGGSKKVAEQVISLRNQGQPCVAVLDSDPIGKQYCKQLSAFRHPVVAVPVEAVNLPNSAYNHVQRVAEIEDLLPVSIVKQFLSSEQRQPELEIRAPTGVRYVIDNSEKRDLALWVVENVERESVPQMTALLDDLLTLLGIEK